MLKFHPLKTEEIDILNWKEQPLAAHMPQNFNLEASLQEENLLLTLFDEDKLIGMLEMKQRLTVGRPVCAVIESVTLLPEYRRHGLGRMLMALAASAAAERSVWFLAAREPASEEAKSFAAAMHFRKTEWYSDYLLLDLSDVEGMRHG